MKKLIWLLLPALLLLAVQVHGSVNCTPPMCPDGYSDNGTYCEGGMCVRECYIYVCDTSGWEQVYSDTSITWQDNDDFVYDSTSGYTPASTDYCYRFTYDGPVLSADNIKIQPSPSWEPGCDAAAIGVLYDGSSVPWYKNMTNSIGNYVRYLGDLTSPTNTLYGNKRLQMMRAHQIYNSSMSSTGPGYREEVAVTTNAYCAPSMTACNYFANNDTINCQPNCYGRSMALMVVQGFMNDTGSDYYTMFDKDLFCSFSSVANWMKNPGHYVYRTRTNISVYNTTVCYLPINITSVKVLPINATAGDDLVCNYTYPEHLEEQNSTYEWWKNGVDQNIDNKMLGRWNLTPSETWFCKVTAGNGLNFSDKVQSENNVTILITSQSPMMFVSDTEVWSKNGYYGGDEWVYDFVGELQNYLDNCAADGEGMCSIPLTFYSNASGKINISGIEVYYIAEVPDFSISPPIPFYEDRFLKVLETNIMGCPVNNSGFNWSLDVGDGTVLYSVVDYNLSAGEVMSVITENNYSQYGHYSVSASAGLNSSIASSSANVQVEPINISSFSILNQNGSKMVFDLAFSNYWDASLAIVNWSLQTGLEQINTAYNLNVSLGENISVIIYYNYTSSGTHDTNASIHNGTATDYAEYQITI